MLELNKIYCGACETVMRDIDSDCVDCIVTDPPYGMSFMGKNWDKAVPSIAIWQEGLRVLKPGAFAFVMCIPRQDCLARMICRLEDAGFNISFSSVLHTFASGFPKAQNLSKAADKRAGVKQNVIGIKKLNPRDKKAYIPNSYDGLNGTSTFSKNSNMSMITEPATPQAKALDGAYGGFQPKPAVEVIIVAMKPLEEKTYLDQAMSNMHGCIWLDDCRIPYKGEKDIQNIKQKRPKDDTPRTDMSNKGLKKYNWEFNNNKGRFPANVLCEDDVLDDGIERKSCGGNKNSIRGIHSTDLFQKGRTYIASSNGGDTGSFSRYFSLDAWFAERIKLLPKEAQKTFPWLIVPKASKSEKNRGLEEVKGCGQIGAFGSTSKAWQCLDCGRKYMAALESCPKCDSRERERYDVGSIAVKNNHPTCKPIKLMSWLITLASREGDIVLDPFCGSGTTAIAAKMLGRQYLGIEREEEYVEIARKRIAVIPIRLDNISYL